MARGHLGVFFTFKQMQNETVTLDSNCYCWLLFIRIYFLPDDYVCIYGFLLGKTNLQKNWSEELINKLIFSGEKNPYFFPTCATCVPFSGFWQLLIWQSHGTFVIREQHSQLEKRILWFSILLYIILLLKYVNININPSTSFLSTFHQALVVNTSISLLCKGNSIQLFSSFSSKHWIQILKSNIIICLIRCTYSLPAIFGSFGSCAGIERSEIS